MYVLGSVLRSVPRRADPPAEFRRVFRLRRLRGSIAPAAVSAIASAIQTQEGYSPGTLAYTNNNPGNLRFVGQPGATQGAGGFAQFSSYSAGLAALNNQITLDAVRGSDAAGRPINTMSDLISSWAPASDGNNTAAYIASVSAATGYDPNAPLSSLGSPADSGGLLDFSSTGGGLDSLLADFSLPDLSFAGLDLSGLEVGGLSGLALAAAALLAIVVAKNL